MFTTQITKDLINKIENVQGVQCFETILNCLEFGKSDSVIFGSVMHNALANLDYHSNDVDILFTSTANMQTFKGRFIAAMLKAKNYCTEMTPEYYSFSYFIVNGCHDSLRIRYKVPGVKKWSYIHGSVLNTYAFTKNENHIIAENGNTKHASDLYIKLLSEKIFTLDYLCNFYYLGKIYSKLNDVVNIKLPNLDYDNKIHKINRKYTFRGVKFSLVDSAETFAPSKLQLTVAKDNYRSKKLVVIPLSRNDNDAAGKAPAVANWTNLSALYDFTVTDTCANIGIVCGPSSGIVCIDVDVKDRGVEMFEKMLTYYGQLPETCPIQRTGNGGYHYIFKYDHVRMSAMGAKIKCPKLNDVPIGIDMWIQQCQFVVEPSVNYTNGNSYKWTKPIGSIADIPAMPEWIYRLYEHENINESGTLLVDTNANPTKVLPTQPVNDDTQSDDGTEVMDIDEDVVVESKYSMYLDKIIAHPMTAFAVLMVAIYIICIIGFFIAVTTIIAYMNRDKFESFKDLYNNVLERMQPYKQRMYQLINKVKSMINSE